MIGLWLFKIAKRLVKKSLDTFYNRGETGNSVLKACRQSFTRRSRFDILKVEKLGRQTISLGKGNTIQPLGIDASQDYIAVIVDRFHVGKVDSYLEKNRVLVKRLITVIIIFARSDGQFVCRLTDCPGVKFVKVHQNTCIASNSSGRTIFIWFGFIFIQNATQKDEYEISKPFVRIFRTGCYLIRFGFTSR